MPRFTSLKDICSRSQITTPTSHTPLHAIYPNLGTIWCSKCNICNICLESYTLLYLCSRNCKCATLRMISRSCYCIVVCATIKNYSHSSLCKSIVLIVDNNDCRGWLNSKDNKLWLICRCVYILTERYTTSIDLNLLFVANCSVSKFECMRTNKHLSYCQTHRRVGLTLKNAVKINISSRDITIYNNAVCLIKARKHLIFTICLKVERNLITLAKLWTDKIEAGIRLGGHLKN